MTRYYLHADLVEDFETYSYNESPIELQDSSNGLWVPKPQVLFLKSLNREIAINWESDFYNTYYCDFAFGDKAFKEYVDQLMSQAVRVFKNKKDGTQMKLPFKYFVAKELNLE